MRVKPWTQAVWLWASEVIWDSDETRTEELPSQCCHEDGSGEKMGLSRAVPSTEHSEDRRVSPLIVIYSHWLFYLTSKQSSAERRTNWKRPRLFRQLLRKLCVYSGTLRIPPLWHDYWHGYLAPRNPIPASLCSRFTETFAQYPLYDGIKTVYTQSTELEGHNLAGTRGVGSLSYGPCEAFASACVSSPPCLWNTTYCLSYPHR